MYDFRKPQYALHTHQLGGFARSAFSSRDAECGIASLVIDPHHADRLYFHLSWNSTSGDLLTSRPRCRHSRAPHLNRHQVRWTSARAMKAWWRCIDRRPRTQRHRPTPRRRQRAQERSRY